MMGRRRHTVGVILDSHLYSRLFPSMFTAAIIRGVQAGARDQDVDLMVACGVNHSAVESRHHPAWPEPAPDVDFMPVGPYNTDGLLVFSPLRTEERVRYIRDLQAQNFPILFIGGGSGHPAISVDNEGGIRQVMEHLVDHGHRDIAFIAGDPQDPGDSIARIDAYKKGVRELNLTDDPRLLEYGQHWDEAAYEAVKRMLKSGVKFTAMMSSNDQSALGMVRALREAGLRIPWDVAITGFDDVLEGLALIPPLTSVHYPLFETGYRALLLMCKRIEEGPKALPDMVRVSTWLVPRQSCGCLPEIVTKAAYGTGPAFQYNRQSLQQFMEELAGAMVESLLAESVDSDPQDLRPLCDRLVAGFFQSLEDGDLSHFQIALIEILQRVETMRDDDAHTWQAAVSILRLGARALQRDGRGTRNEERVEDLLHQARAMLSESARRRYTRMQLQHTNRDEIMGQLTSKLLSSLSEEQIYGTLAGDLPRVGVRSCRIFFFENRGNDPVGGSVLRSIQEGTADLHFETRKFPPPGVYPDGERISLTILPLFFQEDDLGYVAFDGAFLEPLATVVLQASSALRSAKMHQQVLELSLTDELTEVHNRRYFEILLQKETDRSQRYNRDLAVIMADIDRFKQYNDAFGHPAGDRALQAAARCITRGARRGLDVVTRYGGEEFAIILPETDAEGAKIVAEKIQGEMAADRTFLQPTTISLGIASMRGDKLDGSLLVEQGDRALYQAKNQGRNRAIVYEDWMQDATHPKERTIRFQGYGSFRQAIWMTGAKRPDNRRDGRSADLRGSEFKEL
jgi:diguanylate cyclase (GGDEF)-like protein